MAKALQAYLTEVKARDMAKKLGIVHGFGHHN
jgi:hypothetical protein